VSEEMVAAAKSPLRVSEWQRFKRVFFARKVVLTGLIILGIMIITAIFCNWLAPYDPYQQDLGNILKSPSLHHLLGTDQFGRDAFSRLLYGSRTALMVGFISVGLAAVVGIAVGVISGYVGGVTSLLLMRVIDALMAIPLVLLALMVAALLGGGLKNVIIALAISTIPPYARVMNGQTLSIKERDYILALRANRTSKLRIIFKHIIPNAFAPIMVLMTLQLGQLILTEATLSFLGIGIEPPQAAWGSMIADGVRFLTNNPIISIGPGIAIILVVFAFNMVGDGLNDALDPRLRGTL
jgi:peptide/nickel transport system permease protein